MSNRRIIVGFLAGIVGICASAANATEHYAAAGPLEFRHTPWCLSQAPRSEAEPTCVPPLADATATPEVQGRALLRRAEGFALHHDTARADEALRQALTLLPNSAEAWHLSARFKLKRNDQAGAGADIEKALTLNSADANIIATKAYLASVGGRSREALQGYEATLKLDPGHVFALVQRIYYHQSLRDADAFDRDLKRLAELDPGHPLIRNHRVASASRAGDFAGALAGLEEMLADNPARADLLIRRAEMFQRISNHTAAVRDYTAVLGPVGGKMRYALDPVQAGKLHFARALSLSALRQREEAQADITRAVGLADTRLVLRLQVFLRHKKFTDVEITGQASPELTDALRSCMMNAACGKEVTTRI